MARAAALETYRAKRNFGLTAEPSGEAPRKKRAAPKVAPGFRLIVQHHFARRDHYDLRLEMNGVLASWAVTRGPSANPHDKRLAVRTEDHPLDYADFEGTIPQGEYGGGTVILWEYATYSPANGDPAEAVAKGEIKFVAHGERMKGRWVLVRMHTKEKRENWLLIKERDEFAEDDDSLTARFPDSVKTERTRTEIETGKPAKTKAKPKTKTKPKTKEKPAFVPPQLCSVADTPPEGPDWIYELKYDGYRLELAAAGGEAIVYTRSGLDWTKRFPGLAAGAAALNCSSALIDGEAVVLDDKGVSQFPALVAAIERRSDEIVFFAFDLLALDGKDLRKKPLAERQAALRKLIPEALPRIRVADHIAGDGGRVFEEAVAAGAEGIVAKNRTAPYVSDRTHAFVKIKGYPRTDVVIVGYKPSTKGEPFASLQAAIEENGRLRYVGGIGTGYTAKQRADIFKQISPGASTKAPPHLDGKWPRDVKFLKQPRRAEIRFGGWTGDGNLRQARFLALREDLPVASPPKTIAPTPITHGDRVVFANAHVTKGEIAAYYDAVAERMAPHLDHRLVSIVRAPENVEETFFQRHPLRGMEKGVLPFDVEGETYMALDGALGLHTAAQFGAIELHGWMSTTEAIDAPDRMVFDLDPDEDLPFEAVKRAAFDIAKVLKDLKLKSWPLVSGGKGVHVVAPLDASAPYAETEPFAKGLAEALAAHQPQRFVATMSKQRRKGRIFVDWLRNKKSATAILPWSLRARAGATVAVPLSWDALEACTSAAAFDMPAALKQKDAWRGFFKLKQNLPKAALSKL